MPPSKACGADGCDRPKTKRSTKFCYWHWLLRQPIEEQVRHADWRLEHHKGEHRARVPKSEWPDGSRWCAGCQSFVPDVYARGSRCRACSSKAAHASHVRRIYDITEAEYAELLEWQDGRCYVCGVRTQARLAVDHDHQTGAVRGLLCANNEWGCNVSLRRLLGDLDAARRLVAYVERAPLERMRAGEPPVEKAVRPISDQVRFSVLGHL